MHRGSTHSLLSVQWSDSVAVAPRIERPWVPGIGVREPRDEQAGLPPRSSGGGVRTTALCLVAADLAAMGATAVLLGTWWPVVSFVVAMLVWRWTGLYHRLALSVLDDLPLLAFGLLCGVAFLLLVSDAMQAQRVVLALAIPGTLLVGRSVAYAGIRAARARGRLSSPTLLLGAGQSAVALANRILERPETGLRPVGYLADADLPGSPMPLRRRGRIEDLESVIAALDVADVIVCDDDASASELLDRLRICSRLDLDIYVVPRLMELDRTVIGTDQVWGLPLERVRRHTRRSAAWRVKRLMDLVFSGVALVLFAPLMALIAAAVRWELGPGVLFRQERVGLDGSPFIVRKFRSIRKPSSSVDAVWSTVDPGAVGPVGAFIRKYSLDELPQLFNVLVGDMSLVGPRPELPQFVSRFSDDVPGYTHRHRVPAGLTGLAAVEGLRGNTSVVDRAYFDNLYIEHWSLWLDLKIMARTAAAVLRGTGT
jgi:exopolysaccharide biosynthesis polyprenyl glycosylphosphotransferase